MAMCEELKDAIADMRRAMTRLELELMDAEMTSNGCERIAFELSEITIDLNKMREMLK